MKKNKRILAIFLLLIMLLSLMGCADSPDDNIEDEDLSLDGNEEIESIDIDGSYYSLEDVSLYLYRYQELPSNYLTKNQARDLGWIASEGNLWDVTDKGVIGGDRFGNREGLLPNQEGRQYYEADIDYDGGHRGAKRIVYSNDGLIFYTEDHYNSFEEIVFE